MSGPARHAAGAPAGRRLVVHVGHPKTGSTALQQTLAANAGRLRGAGVLYPVDPSGPTPSHAAATPWLTGAESRYLQRRLGLSGEPLRAASRAFWEGVASEVAASDCPTVVLSSEAWWSRGAAESGRFRQALAALADRVTLVAYLRSPARFALSKINQNVRMLLGVRLPPAERFRPVLGAFEAGGFDDIALHLFETERLAEGDVVADFCRRHLPADLPALARPEGGRANESVSNEALALLDEVVHSFEMPKAAARDGRRGRLDRLVRDADAAVAGDRRPSLRPEVAEALTRAATDLAWLRDRMGVGFRDVDYDLAGVPGGLDLGPLRRVADLSPVDPDRLAALRGLVWRDVERLFAAPGAPARPGGRPA